MNLTSKASFPKILEELIASFLTFLCVHKQYSPHTISNYKRDLEQFFIFSLENFKTMPAYLIDHQHCYAYIDTLNQRKLSRRSMARKLSALRSFYAYLTQKKYIPQNPFKGIKLIQKKVAIPKSTPTKTIMAFLDHLDYQSFTQARQRFCFECLFGTGLRISELLNINLSHLNIENAKCLIKGKGSKERWVFFSPTILKWLNNYLIFRQHVADPKQDALILSKKGQRLSSRHLQRELKSLKQHCGLPDWFSPHHFRHAFATALLNNGASLNDVKSLLGHESIKSTQVYTHVGISQLKKRIDTIKTDFI